MAIVGPSPRVRGKPHASTGQYSDQGSIPARAGETCSRLGKATERRVHPRACGGNDILRRGHIAGQGPSPRVRGKHRSPIERVLSTRSIPARAGETQIPLRSQGRWRVHPRACGGNPCMATESAKMMGPSPRVRGKRTYLTLVSGIWRSIPARAGETLLRRMSGNGSRVHPRACGGNNRFSQMGCQPWGPSPRVRGKPRH